MAPITELERRSGPKEQAEAPHPDGALTRVEDSQPSQRQINKSRSSHLQTQGDPSRRRMCMSEPSNPERIGNTDQSRRKDGHKQRPERNVKKPLQQHWKKP